MEVWQVVTGLRRWGMGMGRWGPSCHPPTFYSTWVPSSARGCCTCPPSATACCSPTHSAALPDLGSSLRPPTGLALQAQLGAAPKRDWGQAGGGCPCSWPVPCWPPTVAVPGFEIWTGRTRKASSCPLSGCGLPPSPFHSSRHSPLPKTFAAPLGEPPSRKMTVETTRLDFWN